ncbi:MAG TPA: FAD-dependent monooxygenase [Acidimicrobiales bacterium]|nr:FAD-dependent monooxygenase [Acidimicrobiales bacterium]
MTGTGTDVLVVGAGPTGLTLAAQLRACGAAVRIVDRLADRVHESRALAIQPRTLEVLAGLDLADALVERGNPAVGLHLHARGRTVEVPLFDMGVGDTAYPYLLFLSQATTEEVLHDHLARQGVAVERRVELTDLDQRPDHVRCTLAHRHGDGGGDQRVEQVEARYVVGCDGARSTVRARAGIDFVGAAYPQTFVLADFDADGLEPGAAHAFLADAGMLLLFPLAEPAAWRLIGWPLHPVPAARDAPSPAELQALVDAYAADPPVLHDPVWATYFRLQHRQAASYRSGRLFLAGDAAHVHSPAGGQGMNTGIQDAWNLGWKLALVVGGTADPALLDSYEAERQPVARDVLRLTDRAFRIATSTRRIHRIARTRVAPWLARLAGLLPAARAAGFRTVAELAIDYRASPAVTDARAGRPPAPRAGDRLPDAPVRLDGAATTLGRALAAPRHHLVCAGPSPAWAGGPLDPLAERHAGLLDLHRLSRRAEPGALHDVGGAAHRRLGLGRDERPAQILVRPDGHIAYRADGTDVSGLTAYLSRWYPGA